MQAWLLSLWDSGAESVMLDGPEISKLAPCAEAICWHPIYQGKPLGNRLVDGRGKILSRHDRPDPATGSFPPVWNLFLH